jgi:hypothetical protein
MSLLWSLFIDYESLIMHASQETIVAIATRGETHPAASPDCHCLPKRTTRTGRRVQSALILFTVVYLADHRPFDDPPDPRFIRRTDSVALKDLFVPGRPLSFVSIGSAVRIRLRSPWSIDGPDDR